MLGFRLNKLGAAIRNFRVSDLFTGSTEGGYYDLNDINASPDGYHATNGQYELLNDGRGKVNLAIYSEVPAQWNTPTNLTASTDTIVDSGITLTKYLETTATGLHGQDGSSGVSFVAGTTYTCVFHVQAIGGRYARLAFPATIFTARFGGFDLSGAGSVVSNDAGITAQITRKGDIYECAITAVCASSGSARCTYFSSTNGTTISFTGDAAKGLYVGGHQINTGNPTAYQFTNDTTQGPGQPVGLELPGNRDGLGILNELSFSEDYRLSGGGWTSGHNVAAVTTTEVTSSVAGPVSNCRVWQINLTAGNSWAYIYRSPSNRLLANTTYTLVCEYKQGTETSVRHNIYTNSIGDSYIEVDLTDGTVSATGGSGISDYEVRDSGNGWWQLLLEVNSGATVTTTQVQIARNPAGSSLGTYLYATRAHLHQGTIADFDVHGYQANGPYLGGPGEIWGQATSTARPTFAEIPKVGRRNQYASTDLSTYVASFITMSGTEMVEQTGTGQYYWIRQTQTLKATTQYTASIKFKPSAKTWSYITVFDGTDGNRLWFDLDSGVVGSVVQIGAGFTSVSHAISVVDANGFYTCEVTFTTKSNTSITVFYHSTTGDAVQNYSGTNGVVALEAKEPQLEFGPSRTAFQAVSAVYQVTESGVPSILTKYLDGGDYQSLGRQYLTPRQDGLGIVSLLLQTNSFTSPSWGVKTNVTLTYGQSDPDGGTGATRVARTSGASSAIIGQIYTGLASTDYAGGFWVRVASGSTGTVDLVIGDNVNQTISPDGTWQFFSATDNTSSTTVRCYLSLTGAGDTVVDIYQAILKQGTTVTSAEYQANSYTLGGSLGTCGFFCEPTQTWAVGGVFSTYSTAGPVALFAKSSAASTGTLFVSTNNGCTAMRIRCRGTINDYGTIAADGSWHSWLLVWDGSTLKLYINNDAPITVSVGTNAEEAENILAFARTSGSPASYFIGMGDIKLMRDTYMNAAEIAQWRNAINTEYGVA